MTASNAASPPNARLPVQDRRMAALLLAVMLLADVVVFALRGGANWPAFVIMPGTLAILFACFAFSLARLARNPRAGEGAVEASARFMGVSLTTVGCVMTVAHIGMLAFVAGLLGATAAAMVLPLFMVGLSVTLMLMYNRMPKFMGPHAGKAPHIFPAHWTRLVSWIGVLCGLPMIVIALIPDLEYRAVLFLSFALTPSLLLAVMNGLLVLRRRKAT